ncbi:hypothetical protein FOZ63_003601 [Perkinsus olseni]|uniref:Uncharacterized protein n=1 Tax=Perkinsus olseni TaxID=32597 RepID=A0A7J6SWF3_PEROL|nr:hypothetical protein FOZ63_003601 [Perkinsus olseni]
MLTIRHVIAVGLMLSVFETSAGTGRTAKKKKKENSAPKGLRSFFRKIACTSNECEEKAEDPPRREINTAAPRFPVDSPPRRRIRVLASKSGLDGDQTPSFPEAGQIEKGRGTPPEPAPVRVRPVAGNARETDQVSEPGRRSRVIHSSQGKTKKRIQGRLSDRCSISYTFPSPEASQSDGDSNSGGVVVYAKELTYDVEPKAHRRNALDFVYAWENGEDGSINRMTLITHVTDVVPSNPVHDAARTCSEQTQLWGKESLSRALKQERSTPAVSLRTATLGGHIASMQGEIRQSGRYRLDPTIVPVLIWGLVQERMYEKRKSYFQCPPVKTLEAVGLRQLLDPYRIVTNLDNAHHRRTIIGSMIGGQTITIKLGAAGLWDKLKFHEIEITRSQAWKRADVREKSVRRLQEVEEATTQIEEGHSEGVCEEQLAAYGRTIQDYLERLLISSSSSSSSPRKSIMFEELDDGKRRSLVVQRAAQRVYHALMTYY